MDQGPRLGQLIEDGNRRRDSIPIAVAPVTAAAGLAPDKIGTKLPGQPRVQAEILDTVGRS
jgi:hypothetical protein